MVFLQTTDIEGLSEANPHSGLGADGESLRQQAGMREMINLRWLEKPRPGRA